MKSENLFLYIRMAVRHVQATGSSSAAAAAEAGATAQWFEDQVCSAMFEREEALEALGRLRAAMPQSAYALREHERVAALWQKDMLAAAAAELQQARVPDDSVLFRWRAVDPLPREQWATGGRGADLAALCSSASQLRANETAWARAMRLHAVDTGEVDRLYNLSADARRALVADGVGADAARGAAASGALAGISAAAVIAGQLEAAEMALAMAPGQRPLSREALLELHGRLTRSSPFVSVPAGGRGSAELIAKMRVGKLKLVPNSPRGTEGRTVQYCPPSRAAEAVDRFAQLYNEYAGRVCTCASGQHEDCIAPEALAAWAHSQLGLIHPFQAANGRVARALATAVLVRAGLLPLVVGQRSRDQYFRAVEQHELRGDASAFADFIARQQNAVAPQLMGLVDAKHSDASCSHVACAASYSEGSSERQRPLCLQSTVQALAAAATDTAGGNDLDAHELRALAAGGRALYVPRYSTVQALAAAATDTAGGNDLDAHELRALAAGGRALYVPHLRGVRLCDVAGASVARADLANARLPASLRCAAAGDGSREAAALRCAVAAQRDETEQREEKEYEEMEARAAWEWGWKGLDATGADLSGHVFDEGVDLRGAASLRGARVARCVLRGALFSGDLTGCVFDHSDLTNAVFAGAKLDGASFEGCLLADSDFRGCTMDGVVLRGARLLRTRIASAQCLRPTCMDGARLEAVAGLGPLLLLAMPEGAPGASDVVVADSDIEGRAWGPQLHSWTFEGCRLTRCDFTHCRLNGVHFVGSTTLVSCDIGGPSPRCEDPENEGSNAEPSPSSSSPSLGAEPRALGAESVEFGSGVTLRGCRLAGADMSGWTGWRGVVAEACDLRCACLPRLLASCKLTTCDMRLARAPAGIEVSEGTTLVECQMRCMAFVGASMSSSRFEGVRMSDTVWSACTLRGVEFVGGTDLRRARFDESCLLESCTFRSSSLQDAAACVGRQCSVRHRADERAAMMANEKDVSCSNREAKGAKMAKCTLADVELCFARLGQSRMDGVDLSGADLRECELPAVAMPRCNMRGCDLAGRNLRGCDLRECDLSGAAMHRARLGSADLSGASLEGAEGLEAAEVTSTTVMAGARLSCAKWLRGRDLRGVDMSNAELRGADVRGTDLRGANLEGADLSMVELRAAKGVDRTTRMARACLNRADLSGMDLRGAQLSKADMSGAVVSCVDLRYYPLSMAYSF
eukprot:m51a1_g10629 hypothetical protein (1208) ;mRNA; r:41426-53955